MRRRLLVESGDINVGDLVTIDGESWRVVSVSPLVVRRCRDGRIGLGFCRGAVLL